MDIEKELDQAFSVMLVTSGDIPQPTKIALDDLLNRYQLEEILLAIDVLKPRYQEEEILARKCMGGSGIGAEFHMAAALRVHYLDSGLKYIKSVNKRF